MTHTTNLLIDRYEFMSDKDKAIKRALRTRGYTTRNILDYYIARSLPEQFDLRITFKTM